MKVRKAFFFSLHFFPINPFLPLSFFCFFNNHTSNQQQLSTMGKSQSKLSADELKDLQRCTRCKSCWSSPPSVVTSRLASTMFLVPCTCVNSNLLCPFFYSSILHSRQEGASAMVMHPFILYYTTDNTSVRVGHTRHSAHSAHSVTSSFTSKDCREAAWPLKEQRSQCLVNKSVR